MCQLLSVVPQTENVHHFVLAMTWNLAVGFRINSHTVKIVTFTLKYGVLSEIQNCHIVMKEAITET